MNRETILRAFAERMNAQRAPWPEWTDGEAYTLLADGPETVQEREYDREIIAMTVGVRRAVSFTGNDALRATVANQALAMLRITAYGTDRTLGGSCLTLNYVDGNTEYPTDGSQLVGAVAVFSILYERSTNPAIMVVATGGMIAGGSAGAIWSPA